MKILAHRAPYKEGGKTAFRIDVELDSGIRLYDLKLVRGPNGLRVYGPKILGGAAVTFPPAIADQIAALATEAVAHDHARR